MCCRMVISRVAPFPSVNLSQMKAIKDPLLKMKQNRSGDHCWWGKTTTQVTSVAFLIYLPSSLAKRIIFSSKHRTVPQAALLKSCFEKSSRDSGFNWTNKTVHPRKKKCPAVEKGPFRKEGSLERPLFFKGRASFWGSTISWISHVFPVERWANNKQIFLTGILFTIHVPLQDGFDRGLSGRL